MPTPYPAGSVLEIRLVGEMHGQQTINTFHYVDNDGDTDVITAQNGYCDEAESTLWEGYIRPLLAENYTLKEIQAQFIHPTRFRYSFKVPANPNSPNLTDGPPSGVAVVVRRITDKAGKKFRGRIYLCDPQDSDIDASKLTNAALATWTANAKATFTASLNTLGGNTAIPIIWSPTHGGTDDIITDAKVDQVLRYQRRREVGVGV